MKTLLRNLSLALALTLSADAFAQRVVIQMDGKKFQAHQNINLKQLIRSQRPNIKLANFKLNNVTIKAKSKFSSTYADLEIDGRSVDTTYISKAPNRSFREKRGGYSLSNLRVPYWLRDRENKGKTWKLALNDVVRVKFIEVDIQKVGNSRDRDRTPSRFQEVISMKADKFVGSLGRSHSTYRNVKALKVSVDRSSAMVEEVLVSFGNGNTKRLSELEGYYTDGEKQVVRFNNPRNIVKIFISARSLSSIGSRAAVKVALKK